MNRERRKKINNIVTDLKLSLSKLESIKNEEEYCYDNMPENLQGSQRGEDSQDAIELLENAINSLEEAINEIESIW